MNRYRQGWKLTDEEVVDIQEKRGKVTQLQLAKEYNVSIFTIYRIHRGQRLTAPQRNGRSAYRRGIKKDPPGAVPYTCPVCRARIATDTDGNGQLLSWWPCGHG